MFSIIEQLAYCHNVYTTGMCTVPDKGSSYLIPSGFVAIDLLVMHNYTNGFLSATKSENQLSIILR